MNEEGLERGLRALYEGPDDPREMKYAPSFAAKGQEGYVDLHLGYGLYDGEATYVPAFGGSLRPVFNAIWRATQCRRIIFTCVLAPEYLRPHLRNIVREWRHHMGSGGWSACIEVEYSPRQSEEE